MRFDYQPALVNFKILKTSKQRKTFLMLGISIIGCLIILSSIAHTLVVNKKSTYAIHTHFSASNLDRTPNSAMHQDEKPIISSNLEAGVNFNDLKSTLEATQPSVSNLVSLDSKNKVDLKNKEMANLVLNLSNQNINNSDAYLTNNSANNWEAIKINPGDTLISILKNLAIPSMHLKDFSNFIKTNHVCREVTPNIKAGYTLKILFDSERNLQTVRLPLAPHKALLIDRVGPKNYKSYYEEKPIIKKFKCAGSRIVGSFYAAAQAAGLNDNLIMEMADIFGWDIDFSMDLRPNDRFKVLYEEKFVDQEKIGTGHILAAEFINQGQKYQAVRFTDRKGRVNYYTPEGYSMNKTFLRNPVKFTRIGSKFSASRHHPILHRLRAHKGVDYVAPSGTPVKAAGDGKIILIGRKGGYGNVIELLHGNKYSTLYAHLSHFAHGMKKDHLVKQGQVIGYVGKTGLATGDHLHYEFRVDGVHRDPLTVQLPRSTPLPSKYKGTFLSHAQQMLSLLNENDPNKSNKI